jgi:proline iminopeptidase
MEHPASGSDARATATIDEGLFASINGALQWITFRGRDRTNPALLIVTGPGVAFSRLAPLFAAWERNFTLIQWDQPGAGATFARGDAAAGGLSLERLAGDAAAVIEFAAIRLSLAKVLVLGISGGSIVGLTLAHRRPDLVSAYIGTGQFVDWARQEALSYAAVLDRARAAGDASAVAELEALGPPPWPDAAADAVHSKYAGAFTPAEQAAFTPALADARYVGRDLPEHDARAQAMAAYAALRDDLKGFDARRLGSAFEVPILFVQGDLDRFSVTAEVQAYAAEISAPRKAVALIEGGGHSCVFMTGPFLDAMRGLLR